MDYYKEYLKIVKSVPKAYNGPEEEAKKIKRYSILSHKNESYTKETDGLVKRKIEK